MTPSERCARCRGLCSLRDCPERGGPIFEPEAALKLPPPASPQRRRSDIALAGAAILILFVLPLVGPFLDKVR